MVNVPEFDELSVTNLYPHVQTDPVFMKHFPDKLPKGRQPSRDYFFNVMNTLQEEYLQSLIKHAMEQRHSANGLNQETKTIVCSNEMWDQLNKLPHVSRKCLITLTFVQNAKGKRCICSRKGQSQLLTTANAARFQFWPYLGSINKSLSSNNPPKATRTCRMGPSEKLLL
jgi:hypothetical protein